MILQKIIIASIDTEQDHLREDQIINQITKYKIK